MKENEMIAAVPRDVLEGWGFLTHGFARRMWSDEELFELSDATSFHRRGPTETNFALKQVIPYSVLVRGTSDGDELFVASRLEGSGEARLHGRASIGMGGHIGLDDMTDDGVSWFDAARREIYEETTLDVLPYGSVVNPVGYVNDDSDEVGRVHWGLVCVVRLPPGTEVGIREIDKLDGGFVPLSEIAADEDLVLRMETWSSYVLHALMADPSLRE